MRNCYISLRLRCTVVTHPPDYYSIDNKRGTVLDATAQMTGGSNRTIDQFHLCRPYQDVWKMIKLRLEWYFEDKRFLPKTQHGFRKGRGIKLVKLNIL